MNRRSCFGPAYFVLGWFCAVVAVSPSLAAEPEIVFDPPPSIVVRKTNGSAARGSLLGIDAKRVRLRIVDGTEIKLELSDVRLILASRAGRRVVGRFEFRPAAETLEELARRIRRIPGAKLIRDFDGDDDNAVPRDHHGGARAPSESGQAAEYPKQNQQFRPNAARPAAEKHSERTDGRSKDDSIAPSGNAAQDTTAVEAPAGADGISICSNCQHELPATVRSGHRCPNCGQLLEEESPPVAAQEPPVTTPQNPFAPPNSVPALKTAPAQSPTSGTVRKMSLDNIPPLAKLGIFAGFILLGWWVIGRR